MCQNIAQNAAVEKKNAAYAKEGAARTWVHKHGPSFLREHGISLVQLYTKGWQKKRFSAGAFVFTPMDTPSWRIGDVVWRASGESYANEYNWTKPVPTALTEDGRLQALAQDDGHWILAAYDHSTMEDTYVNVKALIRRLAS